MLAIPDSGFHESVNKHNSDLMVAADWVEGTVLFLRDKVSKAEVADFLEEQNIYRNDSSASVKAIEFVDDIWAELERRASWLERHCPFAVEDHFVTRSKKWTDAVGHAFCLLLTFAQQGHKGLPSGGWIVTGELFERFSERCLQLQGWQVIRTGWASGIATEAFQDMVTRVAGHLCEERGANDVLADFQDANEEGLDLVGYRPFPDGRQGVPVVLVQCASGSNWKNKVTTPNLDLWRDFIAFSTIPNRCFCFPVALSDDDLRKYCRRSKGMFMERYRLLHGGGGVSRMLQALRADIKNWCAPRIADLVTAAS